MKIFKPIALGHETNFKIVVGYEKIHKTFTKKFIPFFPLSHLKQSGAFVGLAVQISSLRKVKEISNF